MAYNTPPTKATGDTLTAAEWNTNIRDNMVAGVPDIIAAAGDLVVGAGVDQATRLPIGSNRQILNIASGMPAWAGLVAGRAGGSPTSWITAGANAYTPTDGIIQVGSVAVSMTSGSGSATITFPVTMSAAPLIFFFTSTSATPWSVSITSAGGTSVTFTLNIGTVTTTQTVYWLAIGPAA